MKDIYVVLKNLDIAYEKYEHPPVFTVEDAEKYDRGVGAAKGVGESKNIFLRNKKGDHYYLAIVESSKRINLKELATFLNENKLSFGSPEKMMEYLGVTPGAVSPFGLIHDEHHVLHVIVDKDLLNFDRLAYHPNVNTATLIIRKNDLVKFLEWTGNTLQYTTL